MFVFHVFMMTEYKILSKYLIFLLAICYLVRSLKPVFDMSGHTGKDWLSNVDFSWLENSESEFCQG